MATAGWNSSGFIKGTGISPPSGPHTVGCVDVMHQFEGDTRGLLVKLFYPTTVESQGQFPYSSWLSHKTYIRAMLDYSKLSPAGLLSTLVDTFLSPKIPALYGAPLLGNLPSRPEGNSAAETAETVAPTTLPAAASTETFPLVVFSHGRGGMRAVCSGICCDMASHGYVVGAVEHRDRSACVSLMKVPVPGSNGQRFADEWIEFYQKKEEEDEFTLVHNQVLERAKDVRMVVDLFNFLNEGGTIKNMMPNDYDFKQFKGRMNMDMVAIVGHSFGGATTLQSLSEDSRLKCGIGLDTWMVPIHRDLDSRGIEQPLLFINSHSFQWKENVERMMKYVTEPDSSGLRKRSIITIRGTNHYNQTDVLLVMPKFVLRSDKFRSPLDPSVAHALNMELIHAFLRRHLLLDADFQHSVPNLDGEGVSEHLIMGTNIDLSNGVSNPCTEEQPVKVDEQQPVKVDEQQPAKVDEQQPVTVGEQQPAKVDEQQPVKTNEQQPAKVDEQQPVKVDEQQPAKVDEQQPVKVDEQQPVKVNEEQPVKADEHGKEQENSVVKESNVLFEDRHVTGDDSTQSTMEEGHI